MEKTMKDNWTKDVSALGIEALSKNNYDRWRRKSYDNLKVGSKYKVTHIRMTTDFTFISLEGIEGSFNSVAFDFFIDGKEHNIYTDERCFSDALKAKHAALENIP